MLEAGEYFVAAGKPPPAWYREASKNSRGEPANQKPFSYDRIINVMPDGTVSIRRSYGAIEHR